jgi:hypothetical protein
LSGNTDTDTYDVEQVHVIQGGQPLVDASDFFQLVARQRKRHPAQLVDGFCSRFLGPEHAAALSALALQKSVLPFDVCGRALDQLAESHECGVLRKQALQFRSSSAWGWLTRELAQLTDQGAVPSLALTNAASPATVTAASGSAVTDDAATAAGYEPVSWAEAASERGLGERLTRPVWSAEAEQGLPKLGTKTDAKYVWAASEVEFIKKGVDMADIERVLEQGRIMEELIGIGRITDPNHPVRRHSGSSSAFCLYARQDLAPFTVVSPPRHHYHDQTSGLTEIYLLCDADTDTYGCDGAGRGVRR